MTPKQTIIIAVVVLLALLRPWLPLRAASLAGSYEAFAHIVVGALFGVWSVTREKWLLYTMLGFISVEVVCAVVGTLRGQSAPPNLFGAVL